MVYHAFTKWAELCGEQAKGIHIQTNMNNRSRFIVWSGLVWMVAKNVENKTLPAHDKDVIAILLNL
jgi:hypothetical protein